MNKLEILSDEIDVDDATREDAELRAAQVSLRAGKPAEAQSKLQALVAKFPKTSPSAVRADHGCASGLTLRGSMRRAWFVGRVKRSAVSHDTAT